jgi:hypothetical protein
MASPAVEILRSGMFPGVSIHSITETPSQKDLQEVFLQRIKPPMQVLRHPMQSRVFYIVCTSIEDIMVTFPLQPHNAFTLIVTRASHVSAEDCASLVHFCTRTLDIRHSTLVRISAGHNRGSLALAFNREKFSQGNLHPSDQPADMVYLLPHLPDLAASHKRLRLMNGNKRSKLQLFRLAFNPLAYDNVRSYRIPCNAGVEYHEWRGRTFTSGLEIVEYQTLGRVVHPVTPVDATLDDMLPFWKCLKEAPLVRLTWEWTLAKAWPIGVRLRRLSPRDGEYISLDLVELCPQDELVVVATTDGEVQSLPFTAVKRWFQPSARVRVVDGESAGAIGFVVCSEEGGKLTLCPDLNVEGMVCRPQWVGLP